jgi:hypothetical protein
VRCLRETQGVQIGRCVSCQSTEEDALWNRCCSLTVERLDRPCVHRAGIIGTRGISCTGAKRKSDQVCEILQVKEPTSRLAEDGLASRWWVQSVV